MDNNLDPQISLIVYMMEDVRKVLLKGLEGLTKEEVNKPPLEGEMPIGKYLRHQALVDASWYNVITEGKDINVDLIEKLKSLSWENGSSPDLDLNDYVKMMEDARKEVLEYIKTLKDSNLEEEIIREWQGKEYRLSKKWILYHLIEHEAHHRGQMFLLLRKGGIRNKFELDV